MAPPQAEEGSVCDGAGGDSRSELQPRLASDPRTRFAVHVARPGGEGDGQVHLRVYAVLKSL